MKTWKITKTHFLNSQKFVKFLNLAFSIRGSACVHTSTMTATRSGRRDERYYWSSFDAHGSAEPANNTEDVLGIGNRSYVIMPTNVRQAPYISTSAKSGIWSDASSHVSVRSFSPPVVTSRHNRLVTLTCRCWSSEGYIFADDSHMFCVIFASLGAFGSNESADIKYFRSMVQLPAVYKKDRSVQT